MGQHFMYCVLLNSGRGDNFRSEPLMVFHKTADAWKWADAMTILVDAILREHGRVDVDDNGVHCYEWDYSMIGIKTARQVIRDNMLDIITGFKFTVCEINSED